MRKYFCLLLLTVLLGGLLTGCTIETVSDDTEESVYSFYYLNTGETTLRTEDYFPEDETAEFMVQDLLQKLEGREVPSDGVSLLTEEVSVNSYELEEQTLVIDFNSEYEEMSKSREILTRAGIAKTFLQIPEIQSIRFTVEGDALMDSKGQGIGDMTEDTFVEFSGEDTDSYRYDSLVLYFTDKSGKKLVKETRNVYYRRTLPKARVVLEQLAKGPMEEGHYPTMSSESLALSVILSDRICYVSMNRIFQETAPEVSEEVRIYSVVNSILESCEADKVQISIEGNLDGSLESSLLLYRFYEKNEELVEQEDSEES